MNTVIQITRILSVINIRQNAEEFRIIYQLPRNINFIMYGC
jgi:hypothetical protein